MEFPPGSGGLWSNFPEVDGAIASCSEMHDMKEAIYENKKKLEGIGEDYQIQVITGLLGCELSAPGNLSSCFLCWDEKNVNSGKPKLPVSWRFPSDTKPGRLWSVSFFLFFFPHLF